MVTNKYISVNLYCTVLSLANVLSKQNIRNGCIGYLKYALLFGSHLPSVGLKVLNPYLTNYIIISMILVEKISLLSFGYS